MIIPSSTYPELILENATRQVEEMERARIAGEFRRGRRHHRSWKIWRASDPGNVH